MVGRKHLIVLLVLGVVLISGCTQKQEAPVMTNLGCNRPYIKVGNDCCLDEDGDSICDRDKPVTSSSSTLTATTTTSIVTTSTSTIKSTTTSTSIIVTTTTVVYPVSTRMSHIERGVFQYFQGYMIEVRHFSFDEEDDEDDIDGMMIQFSSLDDTRGYDQQFSHGIRKNQVKLGGKNISLEIEGCA